LDGVEDDRSGRATVRWGGGVWELTEKRKRRGTGREALVAALGRKRRGEARVSLGFDQGWLKGGGGLALAPLWG
jgi:hypothetical protein